MNHCSCGAGGNALVHDIGCNVIARIVFGPPRLGPPPEWVAAVARQKAEYDLQLRELRRDLVIDARLLRTAWVGHRMAEAGDARRRTIDIAYAVGLREAARRLRTVLR